MSDGIRFEDPLEYVEGTEPYKGVLGANITMSWGGKIDVSSDTSIDLLFKIVNNNDSQMRFIAIIDSDGVWHQLNTYCIADVIFYKTD